MKNEISNYLKYAIGEIVLVMIGILLALQINNWNEKCKTNSEIENVFTLLELELETNIEQSSDFLRYGYYKGSVQSILNKNKVTPEMIRASPILIGRDFGTRTIKFLDDRLDEIISLEKQFPSRYKGLIPDIKLLKRRIESHRYWEGKALALAEKNQKNIRTSFHGIIAVIHYPLKSIFTMHLLTLFIEAM